MANLQEIATEIGGLYKARTARLRAATRTTKALLLLGALVAGVAHFFPNDDHMHVVGIIASIIVFVSGIVVAVTEQDAGSELEAARQAIEVAREAERRAQSTPIAYAQAAISRSIALYQATGEMCRVIQEAFKAHLPASALENAIRLMLEVPSAL
jgi:hypothetical protein